MNEPVTKLKIEVGGHSFPATLEQNDATAALVDMLPLTIPMSDYSSFEKVGSLGASSTIFYRVTYASFVLL